MGFKRGVGDIVRVMSRDGWSFVGGGCGIVGGGERWLLM